MATRIASCLWLIWGAVLATATFSLFKWQLDYFRSPGPRYYRAALIALPALAVASWIYSVVRQKVLWRYEPAVLFAMVAAALVRYEPKAGLVVAVLFVGYSAVGKAAIRALGLKLGGPAERLSLGFTAGSGILISLLVVLGLAGLYYRGVFVAMLILPPVIFWKDAREIFTDFRAAWLTWRNSPALRHPMAGIAMVFAFVAAACTLMMMLTPSILVDPVSLHLPSIEYYTAQHALQPVPGIDYSLLPQGIETIWTLGYSLAGQPAAQMISVLFFAICLAILFCIARECGADLVASLTGVLCAATIPVVHWAGSVMKNDLALALFQLSALYAFLRWLRDRDFRWIVIGSFVFAQAFGVKYVALFGSVPLLVLYLYAIWKQPRRWPAAAAMAAIMIVFGGIWVLRAYVLTGNPVAPEHLFDAGARQDIRESTIAASLVHYAKIPLILTFDGLSTFESPLRSPIGILALAFAPLLLLAPAWRPRTGAQWACLLFAASYLCYWAIILLKVRYAISPFALVALLTIALMKRFYDAQPWPAVRLSLLAVESYVLLFALMGVMIIEVNGPQLSYFAGRLDNAGYLRAAMNTYGAVEFLKQTAPDASIFSVENFTRAYAPVPWKFDAMWCPPAACSAAEVVARAKNSGAQYAILPENRAILTEVLDRLGQPQRLYRDPHFGVYRLLP